MKHLFDGIDSFRTKTHIVSRETLCGRMVNTDSDQAYKDLQQGRQYSQPALPSGRSVLHPVDRGADEQPPHRVPSAESEHRSHNYQVPSRARSEPSPDYRRSWTLQTMDGR